MYTMPKSKNATKKITQKHTTRVSADKDDIVPMCDEKKDETTSSACSSPICVPSPKTPHPEVDNFEQVVPPSSYAIGVYKAESTLARVEPTAAVVAGAASVLGCAVVNGLYNVGRAAAPYIKSGIATGLRTAADYLAPIEATEPNPPEHAKLPLPILSSQSSDSGSPKVVPK